MESEIVRWRVNKRLLTVWAALIASGQEVISQILLRSQWVESQKLIAFN